MWTLFKVRPLKLAPQIAMLLKLQLHVSHVSISELLGNFFLVFFIGCLFILNRVLLTFI